MCRWEQRVAAPHAQRVVADACADVILIGDRALVVGIADHAVVHNLPGGTTYHGLRIRTAAVATVFDLPADALLNRQVALHDVLGSEAARRLVDSIRDDRPSALLSTPPPARITQALAMRATPRSVCQPTSSAYRSAPCTDSPFATPACHLRPISVSSASNGSWPTRNPWPRRPSTAASPTSPTSPEKSSPSVERRLPRCEQNATCPHPDRHRNHPWLRMVIHLPAWPRNLE